MPLPILTARHVICGNQRMLLNLFPSSLHASVPTRLCCSAALLVRPCIDLFKQATPEVTTLIFTFLAFVFATAFT